jgi:hypothetical protein
MIFVLISFHIAITPLIITPPLFSLLFFQTFIAIIPRHAFAMPLPPPLTPRRLITPPPVCRHAIAASFSPDALLMFTPDYAARSFRRHFADG